MPEYTEHSPAPWKAQRDWEGYGLITEYWDEDDRKYYHGKPIVRIVSAPTGENITNNHDLFEFRNPYDYKLIENAPELLRLLKRAASIIDGYIEEDDGYNRGNHLFIEECEAAIKAATTLEESNAI